jgi:type I restriction enzyme S subunit
MMPSSPKPKALHVPAAYGEPPDGWTWSRLDDVSEGVFDCPHSTPKLTNAGPFVVRTQDIITGAFRTDQAGRVSEETYAERIARVTPSHGDLLYSREGTYFGIAAEVPAKTRVCLGQRMVLIRPDKLRLDFSFLRYWLNSPIMAAHIQGYRDGSVAERLNLPTIRALPVPLPPLPEQKAIARILGTLDDKIELNRRMNATLEAMARSLFQSWFVDFDPVHAKAAGRQPSCMDAATATLFPSSFQDSELGEIPKGWKVKTIGETVELAYGKPLKEENRKGGCVAVFGSNGRVGWHDEKLVTGPGIVVGRKGNPGIVTWAPGDFYPIDTTFYVVPVGECKSLYFLYYALSLQNLASLGADSAVPGLNRNHAYMSKLVIPSSRGLKAFDEQIAQLFLKIHANDHQSRTLATLRDTLLPKLLSREFPTCATIG